MMHVLLGDGEMTKRELVETLKDLWNTDQENDDNFWFLVQGKSDPTTTDKNMLAWFDDNQVYFEIVTDDPDSVAANYSGAQETHTAKRLSQTVLKLMEEKPEGDEKAEVLALFVDPNDGEAEGDRWLNQVIQDAFDNSYVVRAFNDGLVEIDMSAAPEEAPEEPAAPAKKSAAKKAAAPAKKAAAKADAKPKDEGYTREQLEDMPPAQVKEIAAEMGISLPPRTHTATYIDNILGAAEGGTPADTNGEATDPAAALAQFDLEDLADMVADAVLMKLGAALSSAE